MRSINRKIKILIQKYVEGSISPAEMRELESLWPLRNDVSLLHFLEKWENADGNEIKASPARPDFASIMARAEEKRSRIKKRKRRLMAATLVGLLVGVSLYFLIQGRYTAGELALDMGSCGPSWQRNADLPRRFFACAVEGNRGKDSLRFTLDSSVHGHIAYIGDLELRQRQPGLLEIRPTVSKTKADTLEYFLVIRTPPLHQYIVQLPDGTLVRLDGGTQLQYLINGKDAGISYCRLKGQAYVQVPRNPARRLFILDNANTQLQMEKGAYVAVSENGYTRANLLDGKLAMITQAGKEAVQLEDGCNAVEAYSFLGPENKIRDSVVPSINRHAARSLAWTKASRTYKGMPVHQFMLEMGRWYGFSIESLRCLPRNITITATVCYGAGQEEVFAAMEKKGLSLYNNNGMVTFCPPAGRLNNKGMDVAFNTEKKKPAPFFFFLFRGKAD